MDKRNNVKAKPNNLVTLKVLWYQCLNNWKWFALSVGACLIVAAAYLWVTPKEYNRNATIMIKPENNRNTGSFTSQLQNMGDMNLFGTVSDVQNEILCIQSPDIMLETVKRLHLDYTYSSKKHLTDKGILYGNNLPIEVEVEDIRPEQGLSMTLHIKNQEVSIRNLQTRIDGVEINDKKEYACTPDSAVQTAAGVVRVRFKQNKLDDQTIYITRQGYHSSVSRLVAKLSFSLANKQAAIINMSCKDFVPARAEDILNTIVTVYNESWVKDKNQLAIATSDFINERIRVIEDELGTVDKGISSFKSENNMADVDIASSRNIEQTISSENSIRQYTNELYMVRYIRNYMTQSDDKLLPTGLGLSSASLNTQIEEYNNQLLRRDNIARHSSNTSPLVIEINNELSALHAAVLIGLDNEKVRLEQLIQAEQRNQDKYAGRISKTPTLERDLRSIERQQEVKEELYLYLLQKREENELTQAFSAYNTRIVATPYGSLAPVAPKKSSILMLALLLGLFLPLNVIYLKMVLNTVVRGRKDLENLATPFVGEIPLCQPHKTSKGMTVGDVIERLKIIRDTIGRRGKATSASKGEEVGLVVKANSRSIINEAFRVVRSNLEFMLDNGQKKVVMITSFNPGSGKTFVAANLAASLAVKGKKVVVVDFDMRHASLSNYVGRPKQGLSNYLVGVVDSCPILEHPEQENLSIIPSGAIPPNPTELLYSDRLKALIDKLKVDYDLIFLDCPPVEMLADTSIVAQYADKTLFVVRAGVLEREMLPMIDKYYGEQKLPNMAVLLNGTEKFNGYYGYHYGYYHHYGDYYHES